MCMVHNVGGPTQSGEKTTMAPLPSPAAAPIAQPPTPTGRPIGPGTVASPSMVPSVYGSPSMAKQAQVNSDASKIIK